jgi:hypothetical protein
MDQFGYRCGVKSEALLGDHRNETRTGLETRIVELAIALVLLEVGRIRRTQECALVMIKPPGNSWGARVLEIHNGILIAIKVSLIEQGPGTMQQSRINELAITANPLAIEAGKQRRG